MYIPNTTPKYGILPDVRNLGTLPPKVGSTLVLPYQEVLLYDQFPKAPTAPVKTTRIFFAQSFSEKNTATISPDVLRKNQFPDPPPNKIGEEDLAGGFRLSDILTGKSSPMYDLSSGIVQVDNIALFFDAKA